MEVFKPATWDQLCWSVGDHRKSKNECAIKKKQKTKTLTWVGARAPDYNYFKESDLRR